MMHFHSTMPLVGGYLIAMHLCNIIQTFDDLLQFLSSRASRLRLLYTLSRCPSPPFDIPPLLTRAKLLNAAIEDSVDSATRAISSRLPFHMVRAIVWPDHSSLQVGSI